MPSPSRPADWPAIWMLATAQTLAWAGLYYIFAALLLEWERSLGWSRTEITLALTLAVLASGLAAPLAGRLIEAGHARYLFGGGTALGGALIALLPAATTQKAFYALWIGIGLCHATALYEPCFAMLSRAQGAAARRAITLITLVAGFASALAFAGGAVSTAALGWQGTAYGFAGLVVLVAAPLAYLGTRRIESRAIPPVSMPQGQETPARTRRSVALTLGLAFPMMALSHGMLLTHLLPLLDARGTAPALAVLAAALIGPMQVVGRVAMMRLEDRVESLTVAQVSFGGVAAAALLLLASPWMPALIFAAVILHGAAYGLISILKPVVTAELLGQSGIARMLSWMALPYLASFALAPFLGALFWRWSGYEAMLLAGSLFALLGGAGLSLAHRLARR
ncbi:MAG: MFS transporter [Pseudomonadota bacterium]